jgi:peptide/nickel transport system ATP-binding protein
VLAGLADRIAVMYAGRIVESGSVADVLERPMHPYTRGLIKSVPSRNRRGERLAQIPGMTPSLTGMPAGCAFRPRCSRATDMCGADIAQSEPSPGRTLRCVNPIVRAASGAAA